MLTRPERKNRTCCCCIPTRVGIAILAWLYFLGGIGAAVLAFMLLSQSGSVLETPTKALIITLAALSILIGIVAGIGIIATITQSPRFARLFSILFSIWFYLQLALDIAIIALFFAKQLDSLLYECRGLTGLRARPSSSTFRNCERSRNRSSLYYTIQAVIRNIIGFYFTRRVASFSRHCSERVNSPATTQMTPMSGSTSKSAVSATYAPPVPVGGTMFASNFPGAVQRQPYEAQTPAPGQAAFNSQGLNVQGGYPAPYQASAESIQGAEKVQEAPSYLNAGIAKAV